MSVVDASAVLALIHGEPGADMVAAEIGSARLGTANVAEVVGKLVDADIDVSRLRGLLGAAESPSSRSWWKTRNWPGRCALSMAAERSRWATAAAWRWQSAARHPRC